VPPPRSIGLVIVGGGFGAAVRVGLSQAFPTADGAWPWTTLIENVSGAFLLAILLTALTERMAGRPWSRPLIGTGILGAYTTFSTLSYEMAMLAAGGRIGTAVAYGLTSILAGMTAVIVGIMLVRWCGARRDDSR
jgi:CrcB protein